MEGQPLAEALASLGHPTRLDLFRKLVAAGHAGAGPGALGVLTGVPRNLVSYHLQPLVAAGLVVSERRGRDVNYRMERLGIERLAAAVLALGDDFASATVRRQLPSSADAATQGDAATQRNDATQRDVASPPR